MRIQHNIMAMNAYRNYNTNTSALSKNLEKLSSGYKINRAGDDAAGLAISEKMRAQITGLNTASKNVKDGISLVKTAEGAMQEVQDMLNRMVDLATQSANGTYQDAVDREALQAEIDQLNSEINRIADSANFNGIKLLDGSLDKSAVTGVSYNKVGSDEILALLPKDMMTGNTQSKDNPVDDPDIGALETDGSTAPSKNAFEISLDGVSVTTGKANQTFTLKIGDKELKATLDKAGTYSGAQLAKLLAEQNKGTGLEGFGDEAQKFNVTASGNVLKFSNTDETPAGLNTSAPVTWTLGDGTEDPAEEPVQVKAPTADTVAVVDGTAAAEATITFDVAGIDVDKAGTITFNIAGKSYDVEITEDEFNAKDTTALDGIIAGKLAAAMSTNKLTDATAGDFTAAAAGTTITLTSANKAAIQDADLKAVANYTVAGKAPEANGTPDGNALIATLAADDPAQANPGAPAKLEVGVAFEGTPAFAANDTVTFGSDSTPALNLKFNYNGTSWELDGSSTAPDGYDVAFSGSKLTITAQENAEVAANPFGTVSATAVNIANGGTAITDATKVTFTQNDTSWTTGSNPVEGGDQPGTDGPGTDEPELQASDKIDLSAVNADLDDPTAQLNAADITAIKAAFANKVTVGDVEIDLSGIADGLTAGTSTVRDLAQAMKTKAEAAIADWNKANGDTKGYTYGKVRISTTPDETGVMALAATDGLYILADKIPAGEGEGGDGTNKETGYINTGIQNVTNYDAGSKAQLGNATVDFNKVGAWQDGAKITIGSETYTVALGTNSIFKDVKNAIHLTDDEVNSDDFAKIAATKLSHAAAGNTIFTVGHDGEGKTTLQQRSTAKDTTDMTTKEKFASYLGVSIADSTDGAVAGKGLTLQIGDTSESFNQLTVSIGDIHADALGVGGLSISTQEDAQAAIDKIKTAINQVSSIRGTLGATQNRLEHTQNNLSVMAENIQDAESSIRDTDIAEEMMAYTKNNILVQSAQAMLAQANQVPQGVLQLLG